MTKASQSSIVLIVIILVFAVGAFFSVKKIDHNNNTKINSFESCLSAGFPVVESFPRKCTGPNDNTYIEVASSTSGATTNENVHVSYPTPGTTVSSPIAFSGEARGSWYFEGSFPVEVRDMTGKVVAQALAHASGEWMTTNFVPFDDDIALPLSVPSGDLFLVFKNDNPSGDPAKSQEVVIPIQYIRR